MRDVAKVGVEGSIPFARSTLFKVHTDQIVPFLF